MRGPLLSKTHAAMTRAVKTEGREMAHPVLGRLALLVVGVICMELTAGSALDAAPQAAADRVTMVDGSAPERLPFGAVDQIWPEIVHQFTAGPRCDGTGDAGGRFNVIHRAAEGPRYFTAWFLGDRFVVVRYRERPQSEPPKEQPAVAWMGEVSDDGSLRVEATVEDGTFGDACSWLNARNV
jgi:hypothetical protein